MSNLLEEKIFQRMGNEGSDGDNSSLVEYKVYVTKLKAMYAFECGRLFSAFYFLSGNDNDTYYICYRQSKEKWAMEFWEDMVYNVRTYTSYYTLTMTGNVIDVGRINDAIGGVMFLPKLCKTGYEIKTEGTVHEYCKIFSDWHYS